MVFIASLFRCCFSTRFFSRWLILLHCFLYCLFSFLIWRRFVTITGQYRTPTYVKLITSLPFGAISDVHVARHEGKDTHTPTHRWYLLSKAAVYPHHQCACMCHILGCIQLLLKECKQSNREPENQQHSCVADRGGHQNNSQLLCSRYFPATISLYQAGIHVGEKSVCQTHPFHSVPHCDCRPPASAQQQSTHEAGASLSACQ